MTTAGTSPEDVARIAAGLTKAQRTRFLRDGHLLVPTQISWRKADRLSALGIGTIYPFHQRWLGRIYLTCNGRQHLQEQNNVR